LVARWAHNPKAVGSSPAPATQKLWYLCRGFFIDNNFSFPRLFLKIEKLFQFAPKQL
jgi:hypothetical protein